MGCGSIHIHIHQNPRNQSGCGWMWMDLNGYPFSSIYQNVLGFLGGLESMYELLRVSNHEYGSISPLVGVARCHGFAPSPQPGYQRSRVSRPHESPNLSNVEKSYALINYDG